MLFNSLQFLVFFPVVVIVYFLIPSKIRYLWLLACSYYFYMCWNPKYVLLLLASTVVTYLAGLFLERWSDSPKRKKWVLAICLLINFGILFVFKYANFAIQTIEKLLGLVHITVPEVTIRLLLPVGISFYIFQAVSYLIDVYRGDIKPERNFFIYALFVSFFPQLVAGPIERSRNLLPQIRNLNKTRLWDSKRFLSGCAQMLYGFFLKMVIADRAALFVDTVFDVEKYSVYGSFEVLTGMLLFTLQIYCDFAGYTSIAIGAAKILGVELMDNFNTPYFAVSIKDFWNRWHISLSTWFRDYLYFPLGGSRKGKLRKYLNIMIVFGLSGMWHGAGWHYIFWGLLHGVYRVTGEATLKIRQKWNQICKKRTDTFSHQLWKRTCTFSLVAVAWVFFRAASLRQAVDLLFQLVSRFNPWVLFDGTLLNLGIDAKDWNVLILSILILFAVSLCRHWGKQPAKAFAEQGPLFQAVVIYFGIIAILLFGVYGAGYEAAQFIYFQF